MGEIALEFDSSDLVNEVIDTLAKEIETNIL